MEDEGLRNQSSDKMCRGNPSHGRSCKRSELEIGKLPSLRIVPMDSLLLHEEPDPERLVSLRRRIAADRCLKNPPIAAKDHERASHILLDGVNRVEALKQVGAKFMLIQEVDLHDDRLILSTWYHAIEGVDPSELIKTIASSLKVTPCKGQFTPLSDFVPTFDDDCACCIVLADRSSHAIHSEMTAKNRVSVLRKVVALMSTAKNKDRVSYTNMKDLMKNYPDFSALICYREFSKDQLVRLAVEGTTFPSGITRFSVPKRALSFVTPLSFLKEHGSLEGKQAALEEMIRKSIRERKIRFYEEPTFHFDD